MTNTEIKLAIAESCKIEEFAVFENTRNGKGKAKNLFNDAANMLLPLMEDLSDAEVKGEQSVRIVSLKLRAGRFAEAKIIAAEYLNRSDILPTYRSSLKKLVSSINVLQPPNMRSRGLVLTDPEFDYAPILTPVAKGILSASTVDLQKKLARALNASIQVDTDHYPPKPFSPTEIAEDFGVPITVQRQYSICLTKDGALEFMNKLSINLTKHKMRKQFTRRMYESFFDRQISTAGKKPYVFTHAEVLHMQELSTIELPMPEELRSLLQ